MSFLDVCIGIDAHRQRQNRTEVILEVIYSGHRPPELSMKRLPRYRHRRAEAMEPVRQPTVDIERKRVVGDLTYRRLLDRDGMLLQLIEKGLRQAGLFDEKATLSIVVLYEHAGIEDVLVDQTGPGSLLNLEG